MHRTFVSLILALAVSPGWPQTLESFSLPSAPTVDAGVAPVDAGLSAAPAADMPALAPNAEPLSSLTDSSPLPAARLASPVRAEPVEAPIKSPRRLPRARNAALAIMAAWSGLGLAACQDDPKNPPPDYDAGAYPYAYQTYPNGHPLMVAPGEFLGTDQEDGMSNAINAWRSGAGLGPLIPSAQLGDFSRANSLHFYEHDYLGTQNPEGDGPEQRAARVGLGVTDIQEAVASQPGQTDPDAVLQGWLADPKVRARLSKADANRLGVGFYQVPDGGTPYWTVDIANDPSLGNDGGLTYIPYNDGGSQALPPTDAGATDGNVPLPGLDGSVQTFDGGVNLVDANPPDNVPDGGANDDAGR